MSAIVAAIAFQHAVVFARVLERHGATVSVFNFPDTARKWLNLPSRSISAVLVKLLRIALDAAQRFPSTSIQLLPYACAVAVADCHSLARVAGMPSDIRFLTPVVPIITK